MKKDKSQRNSKNQAHGLWENYHYNGEIYFKGNYINDERDGLWFYSYCIDRHELNFNI